MKGVYSVRIYGSFSARDVLRRNKMDSPNY